MDRQILHVSWSATQLANQQWIWWMFSQLVSLLCKRNTHWKENFQIPNNNNNNNKSIKIERICKNKLQLTSGTCTTHITYLWCCDLDIEYWVRQSKCMNEGLSWHACWTSNENFQFTFKPRRKAMVFGSTLLWKPCACFISTFSV